MAEALVRRCRPLLGTFVEISVPAAHAAAIDPAFAVIAHVHARMSFHSDASDLHALRTAGPGDMLPVDPETVAVLRVAAELHRRSAGLFDVAIGARLVADGFLPRPAGIDLRRMTGTAADIEIVDDRHVRCRRPLLIDLGGIAKGHAVDRAVAALIAHGAERGIVNAGGDLRVFGPVTETIHIRGGAATLAMVVQLRDAALATSANSDLRRRRAGRIATPHLGHRRIAQLVDTPVSVIAPRCIVADAMTKIAIADPALATRLLGAYGGQLLAGAPARAAA